MRDKLKWEEKPARQQSEEGALLGFPNVQNPITSRAEVTSGGATVA
jgi:hypothetical protein